MTARCDACDIELDGQGHTLEQCVTRLRQRTRLHYDERNKKVDTVRTMHNLALHSELYDEMRDQAYELDEQAAQPP